MKPLLWLAALGCLGAGITAGQTQPEWQVIVGGQLDGMLAPCGCVKPMSGGIVRRAAATRGLTTKNSLILELGPLSGGQSRQDEIKAETAAQTLKELNVDAVSLSAKDAALGLGMNAAINRLSGGKLISGSLATGENSGIQPRKAKGPFLVGSWDPNAAKLAALLGESPNSESAVLQDLVTEAKSGELQPILMLQAGREAAQKIAQANPDLALIVYETPGNPRREIEYVGKTALVSPGEKGKHVLSLKWTKSGLASFKVLDLGPEVHDDPKTKGFFKQYLSRVNDEKLIETVVRKNTPAFSGSKLCITCHGKAGEVWKKSLHSHALKTLETDGHDRDPECVPCHVVGLDSTKGFVSRAKTPLLADVGCESCHGSGAAHAKAPKKIKLKKVEKSACLTCHTPQNSPTFNFEAYWKRIAH